MVKQDPAYTVFADDFAGKNGKTTPNEVKFLDFIFKKNKVKKVLDVACGSGRLSFLLHDTGYAVSGIDLSSNLIKIDKRLAEEKGLDIGFSVEDMRKMTKHGTFDAAICMWGSFTYLETIDDMLNALKGMNRNLKKNGLIIIDVAPGWHELIVSKKYKLKMHDRPVKDGRIDLMDCRLDPADQFVLQHDKYVVYKNGKAVQTAGFDRKRYFFTPTLFDLLLRLSGFKIDAFYSDRDVRKKLPQKNLKRLIVTARKI